MEREIVRAIKRIVLHTDGPEYVNGDKAPGTDHSAGQIRLAHLRRGWSDIGYHYVIRTNGHIEIGRPLGLPGAHAKGYNYTSIGVCCSGHGDLEEWTLEQIASVVLLSRLVMEFTDIGVEDVVGHNELLGVYKTCPGKLVNLDVIRGML